jgi:hypothetical protein
LGGVWTPRSDPIIRAFWLRCKLVSTIIQNHNMKYLGVHLAISL